MIGVAKAVEIFGLLDNAEDYYKEYPTGVVSFGVCIMCLQGIFSIFLQSSFYGPMLMAITQMLADTISWLVIFFGVTTAFFVAILVKDSDHYYWINEDPTTSSYTGTPESHYYNVRLLRYLLNLGLKAPPSFGDDKLLNQGQKDLFDYAILQIYLIIVCTMVRARPQTHTPRHLAIDGRPQRHKLPPPRP
jgi:hypothetical protein